MLSKISGISKNIIIRNKLSANGSMDCHKRKLEFTRCSVILTEMYNDITVQLLMT